MSDSDNKQRYLGVAVLCALIATVAVILCLLFSSKETRISNNNNTYSTETLYCIINNPEDAFFADSNTINNKHEIKVTYKDKKPDKASYIYTGIFNSSTNADHSNAILHAKYNTYMADYNLSPAILGPTFSVVESKLKINLYTDTSNITSETGKLFFLSPDETSTLIEKPAEQLKNIYSNKQFSCNIYNNQEEEK